MWARQLAAHRDSFQGCVLRLKHVVGHDRHVKVLFCLQRPMLIGFVDLIAGEQIVPHHDEDGMLDEPSWAHNFVSRSSFSCSDEDEYVSVNEVHVLGDAVW
jgi:hypothetical protein